MIERFRVHREDTTSSPTLLVQPQAITFRNSYDEDDVGFKPSVQNSIMIKTESRTAVSFVQLPT